MSGVSGTSGMSDAGGVSGAGGTGGPGDAGRSGASAGGTSGTGGTSAAGAASTRPRLGTAMAGISRRFPTITRDTARPEGGGRAAGAGYAAPYRQWPLLAVCSGVLIGLLITVAEFRSGTLIIGLSLIGGAVMRWVMPNVGMLAVRSVYTDVVTYGFLGLVIVLLAMMAQPDPWLDIPILETLVHFVVGR